MKIGNLCKLLVSMFFFAAGSAHAAELSCKDLQSLLVERDANAPDIGVISRNGGLYILAGQNVLDLPPFDFCELSAGDQTGPFELNCSWPISKELSVEDAVKLYDEKLSGVKACFADHLILKGREGIKSIGDDVRAFRVRDLATAEYTNPLSGAEMRIYLSQFLEGKSDKTNFYALKFAIDFE